MRRSLERACADIVGPDIVQEMREMTKTESDAFWRRVLGPDEDDRPTELDDPNEVF